MLVVWFGMLYLEDSCAIQSLHPVRPLLGATFRYLGALALPMSALVAVGLVEVWRWLGRNVPAMQAANAKLVRHPLLMGCSAVAVLALYSSRPLFDLGFTTELARYMGGLPAGTKIFTHRAMRDVAHLVNAPAARRLIWIAPKTILSRSDALEREATTCDEFWYIRKPLWVRERKSVEQHQPEQQPPLGSYLETPERDWRLAAIIIRNLEPELVLYRRREPGSPPSQAFSEDSPEFRELIPRLPLSWNSRQDERKIVRKWRVPPGFRGKLVRLEFELASPTIEPLNVTLEFTAGSRSRAEYLLKPILYASGGKEFFPLAIPSDADECVIDVRFTGSAKAVDVTGFRAVLDDPYRRRFVRIGPIGSSIESSSRTGDQASHGALLMPSAVEGHPSSPP